jgi:peptidoglycan/xylan/chitin deacetylase (PgdA/CDA1 family)
VPPFTQVLKNELNAGHSLAHHSFSHPSLITLTDANVVKQFADTRQQFKNNVCADPMLYRPPFGNTNAALRTLAGAMGLRGIM